MIPFTGASFRPVECACPFGRWFTEALPGFDDSLVAKFLTHGHIGHLNQGSHLLCVGRDKTERGLGGANGVVRPPLKRDRDSQAISEHPHTRDAEVGQATNRAGADGLHLGICQQDHEHRHYIHSPNVSEPAQGER